MTRKSRFVREAALELRDARRAYDHGEELVAAVVATLDRVAEAPDSFMAVLDAPEFRWALVPRFFFKVYFEVRGEVVRVLAIAHPRRKPLYWTARRP